MPSIFMHPISPRLLHFSKEVRTADGTFDGPINIFALMYIIGFFEDIDGKIIILLEFLILILLLYELVSFIVFQLS